MDNQLKVRFKIGEIEFEAEGLPSDVERERESFKSTLLPLAIDAMTRARRAVLEDAGIQENVQPIPIPEQIDTPATYSITTQAIDLSRTSLASFIKYYGDINEQDFALISAYYEEKKNNITVFSSEDIKKFYADARRTEYSNISMLLRELARKGYIMDNPEAELKTPKQYIITADGIKYIESYVPKEASIEKKAKTRKTKVKIESTYASLNVDTLNLKNYPEVKAQNSFKKQMILTLFIVYNEGHGDVFSAADVQCLLNDKLGLPATKGQIHGVFSRHKTWFSSIVDESNKKSVNYKLLTGAQDFAKSIIDEDIKT